MKNNVKNKHVDDDKLINDILLNVVSTTECTGMVYKPPINNEETENYSDIYHGPEQCVTHLDEDEILAKQDKKIK